MTTPARLQNMITQVAGIAGIFLQIAIFLFVALTSREGDRTRGIFYGAIAAIYGYSLTTVFGMFFGISWIFINFAGLVALVLCAMNAKVRALIRKNSIGLVDSIRRNISAMLVVTLATLFQFWVAVLKPELSVDGQIYHGPTMVQMIQTGSLWGWAAPNEYLYYSDLSMASGLNLSTFSGHVIFDDAIQIQHLLVLMLGINWMLQRRFKSSFVRMSFALLLVSAPVIWLQPRVMYVDLAYGAAVASAIFILSQAGTLVRRDMTIAAIAIGGLLGTKPAGVITSVLLFLFLVGKILWQNRNTSAPTKWSVLRIFPVLLIPIVAGMSMYFRNWITFKSPTYPVATDIGPFHFDGFLTLALVAGDGKGETFSLSHFKTFASSIWHGMTGGLTKLDYDPRDGGFGFIPLFVALLVLVMLVIQLIVSVSNKQSPQYLSTWRVQITIISLALLVLLVQPATSNARYVIAPTVALLTALLLTGFRVSIQKSEIAVALISLIIAGCQIVWTERNMWGGLRSFIDLRATAASGQPLTPGNPWGLSESLSWLPENSCVNIVFENSGGVQPGGLQETTRIATFPYGLYGSELCNSVESIALTNYVGPDGTAIVSTGQDSLGSANYLIVYEDHVEKWINRLNLGDGCVERVASIPGVSAYPQSETVLRNLCTT